MELLEQLFGPTGLVTWPQEMARAAVIFLYGLVAVRLAGRRIFGKWAPLDIIVSIMIGSNLSRALTGNAPLWGTLAATTLLLLLHGLLARAAVRWEVMSRILEGRPAELARDGRASAEALRQHAVSTTDFSEALRQAGLDAAAETRLIVLEPSGRINVLKAQAADPPA